ncbi:Hypothetical predicted protein, partial [Paramuricea clavata]
MDETTVNLFNFNILQVNTNEFIAHQMPLCTFHCSKHSNFTCIAHSLNDRYFEATFTVRKKVEKHLFIQLKTTRPNIIDHYIMELEIHLKLKRATRVKHQFPIMKSKRQNNEITYNAPSDYQDPLESEGQISEIMLNVDEVSQCLSYLDTLKATGPN